MFRTGVVLACAAATALPVGACGHKADPAAVEVIVFAMASGEVDGSQHLWSIHADGDLKSLTPLTAGPVVDGSPALSPGRPWVAFERLPVERGDVQSIVIRDMASGREAVLSQGHELLTDGVPFWAPGGVVIGFNRARLDPQGGGVPMTQRLYSVAVLPGLEGPVFGVPHPIGPADGLPAARGAWSPRGDAIAFQYEVQSGFNPFGLAILSYPSGVERIVLPAPNRYAPRFSPEGDRLAWVEMDASDREVIWVARTDGSLPTRVTCGSAWTAFAWSPDGERMVLTVREQVRTLWTVVVPTLGGACAEPVELVRLPRAISAPAWGR